uniref:Sodium-coupled monocarboxylate transporter 1 n=1 Tax=Pyxicephalus adspersus TaxID=30357 RepID=A0AAV3AZ04_PYXAD|nr:TPA: hypothetical protein GDO54_006884 [Pyxicephalus adspersus]
MATTADIGLFSPWDYVVFAAVLCISAAIGIYYAFEGRGKTTSTEFLTGGRSMTAVPVAMSLTASFMSAVTILGTPADVYRYGAMYSIFAISYGFVVLICAEIFLPVFYRLNLTSTYEYLERRFNKTVRILGTVIFIIEMVLYTGIVIYAPALALNQVSGFNLWGAMIATGLVCTFYCSLGGLKAVIWTDAFQIVIMLAGFIAVIIRGVMVQGGIQTILNDSYYGGRLNFWDFDPHPLRRHTFWTIVIGGTFLWAGIYGVNQSQVQRYIACKTRFQAKLTVSSSINALAAVTIEDLIKPYTNLSEKKLSWLSKGMTLSIFAMIGGPLLGLFSLGMFFPYCNSLGAVVGLLSGFGISLWVGIGAQIYPPLPERSRPLPLSTEGCSFIMEDANWTSTTTSPVTILSTVLQPEGSSRPVLADYWYSLSYLYLSVLGTIVTVLIGIIVSLLSGGLKQNVNRDCLFGRQDCTFDILCCLKSDKNDNIEILEWKSHNVQGHDNPAYTSDNLNLSQINMNNK